MRSLLFALALGVVTLPLAAQQADRPAVPAGMSSAPVTFASASLFIVPAESKPFMFVAPASPQAGMGVSAGRIMAIVIGAAIGGGLVYAGVRSMDCSDCKGDAATYGAIGGAVVGGFIGSAVYSFRQRRAVTPPASLGT